MQVYASWIQDDQQRAGTHELLEQEPQQAALHTEPELQPVAPIATRHGGYAELHMKHRPRHWQGHVNVAHQVHLNELLDRSLPTTSPTKGSTVQAAYAAPSAAHATPHHCHNSVRPWRSARRGAVSARVSSVPTRKERIARELAKLQQVLHSSMAIEASNHDCLLSQVCCSSSV